MKEPKLTLGLTERDGEPVVLISRADGLILNWIDNGLAQLAGYGYRGACDYIGEAVLRMLAIAHPQTFAGFPALTPALEPALSPGELISSLHRQSLEDRTSRYVGAIDALVERHKEALAHTSVPEQWPTFREHLLRTYPD
ncbi:hypothetical protein E4L96_05160 [Massilia arenosa]|uniref:Uncharacterized protein n=1 Tax=Zemynaea arenosa TaxID=2561931 RepID=A0A4Y9SIF8_9BURK|nr:hypothetical protein [Massilia arenosa]TFW25469.1 hypothetical protein E4L96_05160 [Massilia arenosa]